MNLGSSINGTKIKSLDSYEYADDDNDDYIKKKETNNNNINTSTTETKTIVSNNNNTNTNTSNKMENNNNINGMMNNVSLNNSTSSTASSSLSNSGGSSGSSLGNSFGSSSSNNQQQNNNNNLNVSTGTIPAVSTSTTTTSTPLGGSGGTVSNNQDDNYYSMAKIYLNNKPNYTLTMGLGRVDFNMKSEDLDQSWFHKEATRDVSLALLNSKPIGSFIIRPSSQAGSYAMSWVKNKNGEIGHNLIYGLCPGYSLKQNPTSPTDRFWSLQALVEGCDYLCAPVAVSSSTNAITKTSNAKTNSEVVGRIIERLLCNDPCLGELMWTLCIVGENANENINRCEKRTHVKYCDEEYNAPEIIPLNGNSLSLIAQSLQSNMFTHSLHINGYEGYLRMSFQPNIGDQEASALANMLLKNKSITLLNLNVNEITDTGAKAIAYALKSNTTLKYLSLSQNFIGKEGLIALSEAIRVNRSLDFVDVSNQLYKSKNLINLVHSSPERTLISLLEDTLKRKCELLGMSQPIDIDRGIGIPPTISNASNIHNVSLQKLPYFHGFLTKEQAEKRLMVSGGYGGFLFYLNHYIPNSIFLAYTIRNTTNSIESLHNPYNTRGSNIQIIHKMIHRVHFGYRFVGGGLNSLSTSQNNNNIYSTAMISSSGNSISNNYNGQGGNGGDELREETLEEELLYNFQINNRNNENTVTHSNSYNYAYRYRPKRKGCGIVIPTLFEFCSWVLASSSQYREISEELDRISNVIGERFQDIHDLAPLWGSRDVHPVVATLSNSKTIARKGVYPTLAQLYKLNRSKLVNPVTRDQYKAIRARMKAKELEQQQLLQPSNNQQNPNNNS